MTPPPTTTVLLMREPPRAGSAPDLLCDAKVIAAEDLGDGRGGILLGKRLTDLGQLRRSDHPNAAVEAEAGRKRGAVGDEIGVHLLDVKDVVEGDADMVLTDEIERVVDVLHERFGPDVVEPHEQSDATQANHAATGGAGRHQVIRNVAGMVPGAPRVGMRE